MWTDWKNVFAFSTEAAFLGGQDQLSALLLQLRIAESQKKSKSKLESDNKPK